MFSSTVSILPMLPMVPMVFGDRAEQLVNKAARCGPAGSTPKADAFDLVRAA